MELVQRQPLRRRVEQVGEREAEAGALGAEVLAREPEDRQRAERDRDRLRDEQQSGLGQSHQSGANAARIGSKCAPSREICSPRRS